MRVFSVELTSQCNLSCSYCPHPGLQRPKEHMPLEVFERILEYPMMFDIVCAHNFGEPLLYPDLLKAASMSRDRGLSFGFSTNAVLLDMDVLAGLVEAGLRWIKISFHFDKGRRLLEEAQRRFPGIAVIASELQDKHDFAGQVGGEGLRDRAEHPGGECLFRKYDLAVISSQAEVLACCIDAEGMSSLGPVFQWTPQEFSRLQNNMWLELCDNCAYRQTDKALQAEYRHIQSFSEGVGKG